ncbi:MAG: hypothetical protein IJY22_06655 [Clostridia bacterium]|nr:hypothetical protein [Clostridia bacterium]
MAQRNFVPIQGKGKVLLAAFSFGCAGAKEKANKKKTQIGFSRTAVRDPRRRLGEPQAFEKA